MRLGRIKQFIDVNATKEEIYDLWMDSKKHSELIQADAEISPKVGGKISIWNGYIEGKNKELVKDYKIVQLMKFDLDNWDQNHYSQITIKFKLKNNGKTQIIFNHSQIPFEYVKELAEGWDENYWEPMIKYFNKQKNIKV